MSTATMSTASVVSSCMPASVAVAASGLTTGYGQVRFTASAATDDPLFRPLDDAALQRLDDDALIEYMREARANGHASAGHALAILVYGHWRNVERRMRMKIPAAHVEDLTGDVVADAIASAFEGKSVGEFRSWLSTITQRAIADFYRRGAGRMKTVELPAAEVGADPETGEVEVRDAIERVMAKLRPDHQKVVDLVVFGDCSAAEAAQAVPGMTEANVHQIVSRFRRALRGELEAGGDTE
jgi:RNA polymerase sigma-70 factor, ECF subfamily